MNKECVLRTIPFDGSPSSWHMWSLRYEAKMELQGWMNILNGIVTMPKDSIMIDPKDLVNLELRIANKQIFVDLLVSCMDEVSFGCISAARTKELPKGDTMLAWKNLKKQYELTTEASKVHTHRKFVTYVLKQGDRILDFFTHILYIPKFQ